MNVADLGRRPYVPLSHLVTARTMNVGFFMRAEIIWRKAKGAGGNCAWGSWRWPANPVVRDVQEYLLCFSKVDRPSRQRRRPSLATRSSSTISSGRSPPSEASPHPARSRRYRLAVSLSSTRTRASSSSTRSWEVGPRPSRPHNWPPVDRLRHQRGYAKIPASVSLPSRPTFFSATPVPTADKFQGGARKEGKQAQEIA